MSEEIITEPMEELLAKLSERPSREQYEILQRENEKLKEEIDNLRAGLGYPPAKFGSQTF